MQGISRENSLELDLLPYSISAPLTLTIAEANGVRRLYLLVHSFRQTVQFLALCHISDYIQRPDNRVPEGEEILAGLKRPSLGIWVRVMRDLPKILQRQAPLFIEDWMQAFGQLENLRYRNCISADLFSSRAELSAIEALLRLRNFLAHGAIPPDDSLCEELYQQYFPILGEFLTTLSFLPNLIVYRVIRQDSASLKALALRGSSQPFSFNLLTRIICLPSSKVVPDCFLGKAYDDSAYLPLMPMMIGDSAEPEDESDDPPEPLFCYDGLGKKCVYYLGIKRKLESEIHYEAVVNALFTRPVIKSNGWSATLFSAVVQYTLESVSANRNVKFFPEVFQKRERYSTLINEFCSEMPVKIAGLLFVAESGVGKTSLLCETALKLLATEGVNPLPFLILSTNLSDNFTQQVYESGELGALGAHIKQILGLERVTTWQSLLEQLESGIESSAEPQMLLIVDAINEAPNPFHLLQEFDYVVRLARGLHWLRCLGTMRQGTFETLRTKLAERGIIWPKNERSYLRMPDIDGKLTVAIPLTGFSEHEACQTYERYQKQAELGMDVPACLTPYQELPEVLRRMTLQPLILRILMQTYNRQAVPSNLAPTNLFEQFHQDCLTPSQSETIGYIAARCFELQRAELTPSDLDELSTTWVETRDEYQLLVYLDPIEQLLDLGVLVCDLQGNYTFAHQLYLEFLLFKHFDSLDLQLQELLDLTANMLEEPESYFEEKAAALRMLFFSRVQQGEHQLIDGLVRLLHSESFCQFFTPLVFELQRVGSLAYDVFEQVVKCQTSQLILTSGIEIYRVIGDRAAQMSIFQRLMTVEQNPVRRAETEIRYVRLLAMSNRVSEAANALESLKSFAETAQNESLLLGIYSEEGYLNFITGDSPRALIAYSKALGNLERLCNKLEPEVYLFKKREILAGRGCVQHNNDDNEACLVSHLEALKIDQQLGNRAALALDLVNVADAHWGCYRYGQSLQVYQEALDAAAKACCQDAMDVALIGRGMVLWSMGRLADANVSIASGLEIATQLNYSWDLAYGLIYKSNIQSSQKHPSAIKTNKRALSLAKEIGAEYLVELASSYLAWKYEVMHPGLAVNRKRIEDSLVTCQRLGIRGVALTLTALRLLNSMANSQISDPEIELELSQMLNMLAEQLVVKGPWELLGLSLLRAGKCCRPALDLIDLEDVIDEICERKASSLHLEDRQIYLATLKG